MNIFTDCNIPHMASSDSGVQEYVQQQHETTQTADDSDSVHNNNPAPVTHHIPELNICCNNLLPLMGPGPVTSTAAIHHRCILCCMLLPASLPALFRCINIVIRLLLEQSDGDGDDCEGPAPEGDVSLQAYKAFIRRLLVQPTCVRSSTHRMQCVFSQFMR